MKKLSPAKIRLLLVDDHPIVREGIKSALAKKSNITVVGEASSGEEAMVKAKKLVPDVILMDINLPGMSGLEASRRLRKSVPASKILALTMHENREYVLEMSQLGARGYVFKDSSPSELFRAIELVHAGEFFFSPRASQQLLKSFLKGESRQDKRTAIDLSQREKDVLQLIAEGLRTKEVAKQLGVTDRTIETYRRRLMAKLSVHSIAGLIKHAIGRGLVKIE
ncbi:MAG: response regulator transcription factor [Ignavibacteriales bacterium]|nr:response regulator transcription factor [Ignavibacteriales bacterium]